MSCLKTLQCPGHRTSPAELHPELSYLCHPGGSLILPAGAALENQTRTRSLGSRKERTTTTTWAGGRPGPHIRWEAGGGQKLEEGERGEAGCWKLKDEGNRRRYEMRMGKGGWRIEAG